MMAFKYKEGMSTADHVSEFQSVMNQLLGMGVKFDDEILGLWLLATLPNSWKTFRVSFINSAPLGHIKKYCFKLKRENKGGGGDKHDRNDEEKSERAAVTREDLLVICDKNLVNLACDETSWAIDIGASIHVTSRRDFFTSYTPGDFGVLKMGNNGLVSVAGKGDVSLVSNNGTKLILKDVRQALDICLNLISIGRLDDEGFCNTFSDGQWKLTKGSLIVARGKKSSNLYLMQALTSKDTVNVAVNDSSTELWHKRLSHMKKEDSPDSGDLTNVNPVPLDPSPNPIQDDVHGDVNDDQQNIGGSDAPIDDVVTDQQQAPIAPPTVPLRRSSRDRRSSARFIRGPIELIFGQQLCNKVILIVYGRFFHPSLVASDISICSQLIFCG
ncbi:hypothetical protein V6N12_050681 [Hibiscus sabdariffa]|uniref:Retrovirus-related Pol polyprotein from transposon TNT 1-94-like beta-barrel domain-containing protein n=1 Tax=Hibiscus sabdariffa TaxID=183260 RepID=A0ABR2GD34_9ROSI